MQKVKLLIAGCLFSCMFGIAWNINEKMKREYVDTTIEEDLWIQLTNTETSVDFFIQQENVFEKFKPREYVRVVTQ
ncbi:hypothetical protein WQ54_22775 [Bacillus sp. SA1-12]|uniref:hypothetical protein n=1 Tax=Bacillus sp. SA1-12 TaxID=1455638 RepID=UPI00062745C5|nr:hypothetical protein [Bacillus sp. SA1-12]KKI89967.1 hypothetical protein WQ54_22775 [Bacillus sp. SA1-12]